MAKLTRDALDRKVNPPQENRCGVKMLRDTLTSEEQTVLDDAIALSHRTLSAQGVRELLIDAELPAHLIPSIDQVHDHRAGREACKCRR